MLALVAMHFASPNGNRRRYLLCSLHMRIKNWEYKAGVLFRRRVVLLAPCLELINDYSYGLRDITECRRDFSSRFLHEFLDQIRVDISLSEILIREKSTSNYLTMDEIKCRKNLRHHMHV